MTMEPRNAESTSNDSKPLIAAVRDKDVASARALYASYRAAGKKIR